MAFVTNLQASVLHLFVLRPVLLQAVE